MIYLMFFIRTNVILGISWGIFSSNDRGQKTHPQLHGQNVLDLDVCSFCSEVFL